MKIMKCAAIAHKGVTVLFHHLRCHLSRQNPPVPAQWEGRAGASSLAFYDALGHIQNKDSRLNDAHVFAGRDTDSHSDNLEQ